MTSAAERFRSRYPELGLHRQRLSAIWTGRSAATLAQAIAILQDKAPPTAENRFLYLGEIGLTLEDLTRTSVPVGLLVGRREDGRLTVAREAA